MTQFIHLSHGHLNNNIKDAVPWCMSANNVVLINETTNQANDKLELRRKAVESSGLKISRSQTKEMEYKCSGVESADLSW